MPSHEIDISWQVLRQIVQDWLGTSAELTEVTPLTGGCINTALCLTASGEKKCVLKITPHRIDKSYVDEAHQLKLLRAVGIPVPEVYLTRLGTLDHPFSYILMEFVEGIDLGAARSCCSGEELDGIQTHLAELVLMLHAQTASHYMRCTVDEPRRFDSWAACYREIYDTIWHEVEKTAGLPVKARKQVAKLHDRLDRFLGHEDCPRLVHWDLWATNLLVRQQSPGGWRVAALLDPNCKFAHAEAEIAYLELFHTVTPVFMRTYQQTYKLSPDYHRIRKPIYQLYSLLNHLRLFGQEYLKPCQAAVERVAAIV